MLPTEFVVSVSGAYLINLYSSGGWGKLRGNCHVVFCSILHKQSLSASLFSHMQKAGFLTTRLK